jgi:glycosyltransferase involved in cell wall biosynthesis
MTPRKIVQIVTQMEAGGAQRVALLLHREMLQRGIPSELWFLYLKTDAYSSEPGVRSLWPARPHFYQVPLLWLRLWNALRKATPHAVITHTHYANGFAQPAAKLLGIPHRLAVHHNDLETYPAAARYLERWMKQAGVFTGSVAVSDNVRASLLNSNSALYTNSTRRIYNGIALAAADAEEPDSPLPHHLTDHKILFTVGRLTDQKNQQALVAALVSLPDCLAVIAGRGPLDTALHLQAEKLGVSSRLYLLGEVDNRVVVEWMRRADVFVFPSRFEAMPMALLEAMRQGMNIVASDIPAHREIAGDSVLLSTTGPQELSASIRLALLPGTKLGDKARRRSQTFTVAAMADAYLGML